jgi:divalent metal cation (Fe/Co/Zn/Cd) transporter
MSRENDSRRTRLLVAALWLSIVSVAWGAVSGGVSVTVGVLDGSLGVLGLGLNVLADVTGSAVLIWRFRAELRHAAHADDVEARAAAVVAAALGTVSVILVVSAAHALAVGSRPGHSTLGMVTAGLAFVVLAPLAYGKHRVAAELRSGALRGDGTLSGIGAAIALLALAGLALDSSFGWWWADRVAAIVVAGIAAAEAARIRRLPSRAAARTRPPSP